jgi:hypothetical protein
MIALFFAGSLEWEILAYMVAGAVGFVAGWVARTLCD